MKFSNTQTCVLTTYINKNSISKTNNKNESSKSIHKFGNEVCKDIVEN